MSTINKVASAIQLTLPVAGKRVEVRGTSMRSLLKAIDSAFKAVGLTARDAVPMKNRVRKLLREEGLVFKGTDTAKQRASRAAARSIVIGQVITKDLKSEIDTESWNSVAATLRERANLMKAGAAPEVERVDGIATGRVEEYLAADVYKAVPKHTSPKREKLKGSRRSNRFAAPSKPAKSGEALEMSVEQAIKKFVRAAAKARKAARKAAEAQAEREAEREARLERAKATDEALTARAAAKKEAKATRKQARIAFLKASIEELDAELDARLDEFNELLDSGDSSDDQAKLAWLDKELARLEAALEPLETELEKLEPGASC
jgi:flagellar biosynthesis GTPase FlhF